MQGSEAVATWPVLYGITPTPIDDMMLGVLSLLPERGAYPPTVEASVCLLPFELVEQTKVPEKKLRSSLTADLMGLFTIRSNISYTLVRIAAQY